MIDKEQIETMTLIERSIRYRVNVKETAKHEPYWECTVDGTGLTKEEILTESDALVVELKKRYPAPKE